MRPKQWFKNVFLFAALIFSQQFLNLEAIVQALCAFGAFFAVSSSGYILNDIMDIEADRAHPKKKRRPIAAGHLSVPMAYALFAFLLIAGLGGAYRTSLYLMLVTALYLCTTLSYSFYFKHIVILDIMFITAGFLWRVIAGAVAIDVKISPWIIVCTAFLALFLGFNKRRGELLLLDSNGGETRKNLKDYSVELVRDFQAITSSGAILSYALYTILGPQPLLGLTLPFVLYGIFRYIYLISEQGAGGAPDETLLKDKPILLNGVLYLIVTVSILLWS
ncbi:MAG: decaprenyl-phosphate phosphoribosyltransferase [Myxococcota bacterium]|nr:decaprenyl-phosphate phosphoribosyltransferase [Myxococcota bacterium]